MNTDTRAIPQPADMAVPIALSGVFLVTLVGARGFGPMATLLAASLAVAGLGWWLHRASHPSFDRARARLLAVPAAAVAWLLVGTVLSHEVAVSFVGIVGQHTGWLLWLSLLLVFGLTLVSSGPTDARRVIVTVATLGGVAGLAVVVDAVLSATRATYSVAPSGIFENSLSTGQFLLVGLGCAIGWLAMWSRLGSVGRGLAAASAGASFLGLVLSGSRASATGLGLALLLGLVMTFLARRSTSERSGSIVAAILISTVLLVVGIGAAASTGAVGTGLDKRWKSIANDRDDIWDSALLLAAESPVTGHGPDQFSALSRWNLQADGALDYQGTYDPHGIVLNWLVAAGVPGLLLGVAAVFVVLSGLLRLLVRRSAPLSLMAPVAGLVAWAASLTVAWTNPLAAFTAVAVAGALLGASLERPTAGAPTPAWVPWGVAGLGLGAALLLLPAAAAELPFHTADGPAEQAIVAADSYERWPDPAYAVAYATEEGSLDVGGVLGVGDALTVRAESARWDVNVVVLGALATQSPDSVGADARWDAFVSLMDAGREADPESGLWDTLSALEASRRGLAEEAERYAADASEHEMRGRVRSILADSFPDAFSE